jgi:glycosyltransferase involved in cell wall biosynthesis
VVGATRETSRMLIDPGAPRNWLASTEMQARRDRLRIARAQDEIANLRCRLLELEKAQSQSRLLPARNLYRNLRRLISRPVSPAPHELHPVSIVRGAETRGRAIVIDNHWPEPDRDSGSIDIINLVIALSELGLDVILAAAKEPAGPSAARDKLQQKGIQCLLAEVHGSLEQYLVHNGSQFDLCVLCRVYCGGEFLEIVQRCCHKARVVFNTIDLNFLREERKAKLLSDKRLLDLLPRLREREEHIIRESDATILVSDAEMQLIEKSIPEAFCVQMPLARPINPPITPFAQRRGIGFVGGFAHAPNVDAISIFLQEVWPLVVRAMPDCELSIVGADFPQALLDGCPGRVTALGHVPDIGPWFESLLVTVAPLRFGAGAKGKIASSLAAGVPAVVTEVAAEGMSLNEGCGVVVGRDPVAFATSIQRICADGELWQRLSDEGLAYAHRTLGLDAWRERVDGMLKRIGI